MVLVVVMAVMLVMVKAIEIKNIFANSCANVVAVVMLMAKIMMLAMVFD